MIVRFLRGCINGFWRFDWIRSRIKSTSEIPYSGGCHRLGDRGDEFPNDGCVALSFHVAIKRFSNQSMQLHLHDARRIKINPWLRMFCKSAWVMKGLIHMCDNWFYNTKIFEIKREKRQYSKSISFASEKFLRIQWLLLIFGHHSVGEIIALYIWINYSLVY